MTNVKFKAEPVAAEETAAIAPVIVQVYGRATLATREVDRTPSISITMVVGASNAVDIFDVLSWVGERTITNRFDISY